MSFTELRSGIHIPQGLLPKIVLEKIKSMLTITHVGFQQQITKQQAYYVERKTGITVIAHERGKELLRLVAPKIPIVSNMSSGNDIKIDKCELKLEDHQVLLRDHMIKNVYTPYGKCVMELEAGQGKTYLAMGLIRDFSKKTLVIVPNETLLEQWVTVLGKTFPGLRIGEYYGKCHEDGDIVVASIASLMDDTVQYKSASGKVEETCVKFMNRFGFTVYDEIHMYCTTIRSKIFRKATSQRTLGLSATCFDRLDGMDPIAHYYVGEPIIAEALLEPDDAEDAKDKKVKFDILATQLQYNGPLQYTETLTSAQGTVSHPLMVNQFSKDPWRNKLILDEVLKLYKDGHCVMVFFDRVELIGQFVELLTSHVKNMEEIETPELLVKSIKGGTSKEDRKVANDTSRICCVSYQCGGTGLSMPRYTAAVFAHPRRNGFKQFIKRVCRLGGPNRQRRLVFLQDNRTSLKGQYYGFRAVALKYGATLETRKVDWESIQKSD